MKKIFLTLVMCVIALVNVNAIGIADNTLVIDETADTLSVTMDNDGNLTVGIVLKEDITFDEQGWVTFLAHMEESPDNSKQMTWYDTIPYDENDFSVEFELNLSDTYATTMGNHLNNGTDYIFSVTLFGCIGGVEVTRDYTFSFTTDGEKQGLFHTTYSTDISTKFIENGQVVIKRGDSKFDIFGRLIR